MADRRLPWPLGRRARQGPRGLRSGRPIESHFHVAPHSFDNSGPGWRRSPRHHRGRPLTRVRRESVCTGDLAILLQNRRQRAVPKILPFFVPTSGIHEVKGFRIMTRVSTLCQSAPRSSRLLAGIFAIGALAASACGRKAVEPQGQARVSVLALSAADVAKVNLTVSGPTFPQPKVYSLFNDGAAWGGLIGGLPAGSNA